MSHSHVCKPGQEPKQLSWGNFQSSNPWGKAANENSLEHYSILQTLMLGKTKEGSHKEQNRSSQSTGTCAECCKLSGWGHRTLPKVTLGWADTSLLWDRALLPTHPTPLHTSGESYNTWEVFKDIHKLWSQEFHKESQHKSHCSRNKEPWLWVHFCTASRGPRGSAAKPLHTRTSPHLEDSQLWKICDHFFFIRGAGRSCGQNWTVMSQCSSALPARSKGHGVHGY